MSDEVLHELSQFNDILRKWQIFGRFPVPRTTEASGSFAICACHRFQN